MGNIAFGNKYFILSKFSSIPKTSKIEQDRASLIKEHGDFNAFKNSGELVEFIELENYINSKERKEILVSVENAQKKEQDKISSYANQKESKKFRNYFKFKKSQKLNNYLSFAGSKELADFQELETLVNSEDFKNEIKGLETEKNNENNKIKEFTVLKKSKSIKGFFKFKGSSKLNKFNTINESAELIKYYQLEEFIGSVEFEKKKNTVDPKGFKNSEDGKKLMEFESLKKSRDIKFFFKFKESSKFINFQSTEKSNELQTYYDLEGYINSTGHKEKLSNAEKGLSELTGKQKDYQQKKKSKQIKTFFKFQDSQKFKDFNTFGQSKELVNYLGLEEYLSSKEHKELVKSLEGEKDREGEKKKQYEEFKNSKQYKWHLSLKGSDKFDELKSWELTFEDSFDGNKLDAEKWMTRYLWGDKLINDAYALETDKAFPTDGNNIELSGKTLKIITRNEKTSGKVWKIPFGFIPQEFDYSTGLISTANRFQQKYGRFEAKIKVNYSKPVNYNFWMASENMLPHVDILKLDKKKTRVDMSHHFGEVSDTKRPEKKTAEYSGLDVSQDFFIYTFEWAKDKMTWKINGVVVNEQTQGIPKEEMYLVFSSAITGKVDGGNLPASMEIDWVRCYKQV